MRVVSRTFSGWPLAAIFCEFLLFERAAASGDFEVALGLGGNAALGAFEVLGKMQEGSRCEERWGIFFAVWFRVQIQLNLRRSALPTWRTHTL